MSNQNYPKRPSSNTQSTQSHKKSGVPSALALSGTILRVLITVLFCVFLAIFILKSASDLFGLNQIDKPVSLTIPEGLEIPQMADILADNGVVDQKLLFKMYANTRKNKFVINPGEYKFNANMSYDQIFALVNTGDVKNKYVTISFREGISLDEIATLLEENGVCNADEFLEYTQTADFSKYSFYSNIPKDKERYLKLEGYFFPDTYEFNRDANVSEVANKFLFNFDRRLNSADLTNRMKELDMTLDEVITLASIIEKEASDRAEMRRVSSVFRNRLKDPSSYPLLQSDVTINYVEEHIKGKNRHYTIASTQEVFDAYNTYVSDGLPIGPIANPGEEAIMAALYPAETNYYYFVTDVEGVYYFSTSLSEHDTNVELAASNDETGEGWVGGIKTHAEGEDAAR